MASEEDKTLGLVMHLLGIFTWFIGPLILWLVKKDESPFLDHHGRQQMNLQLTAAIAYVVLAITIIGFFFMWIPYIFVLVMSILGAVKAYQGEEWKIPVTIPFFK